MTTVTFRPTTISGDWAQTGGAGNVTLSDDSDSTYVTGASQYAYELLTFAIDALPFSQNIMVKTVAPRARFRQPNANWTIAIECWAADIQGTYFPIFGQGGTAQLTNASINTFASVGGPTFVPATFPDLTPDPITHIVTTDAIMYFSIYPVARFPAAGFGIDLAEVWADVEYALPPTVVVTGPTGTVTDRANPTVTWTYTRTDTSGSQQTAYQVKVFDTATFSGGGFSVDSSATDWDSGIVASSAAQAVVTTALPNDTYRAYVRVAQSVNGKLHWSSWQFTDFVINVTPPTTPTITPTADNTNARIRLALAGNGGSSAVTVLYEVQRTNDNGVTWVPVRGEVGLYIAAVGGSRVWFDWESGNGESVKYRIRTHSIDAFNNDIVSAWSSASSAVSWSSSRSWLKNPLDPSVNRAVTIRSLGDDEYAVGRTVAQGLGSGETVITRSTRRTRAENTIVLYTATDAESAAVRSMLGSGDVVLIQPKAGTSGWTSRYYDVGTIKNGRVILYGAEASRYLELPCVEKAAPSFTAFTLTSSLITWREVLAAYANWLAVENGNTDWADVRM